MPSYYKTSFNGYAVKFSPFFPDRVAIATSQNFGIIGNGRQHVVDLIPGGPGAPPMMGGAAAGVPGASMSSCVDVAAFDTADGIYDCAWSEENEHVLISACGDGSVKVWNVAAPPHANPLRSFEGHRHEVHAVSWNLVSRDCFVSASWDDSLKLWSVNGPPAPPMSGGGAAPGGAPIRSFDEHTYCVYAAAWNAAHKDVFASASGDGTVKVWDTRQPHSVLTVRASRSEVLSVDWNKYADCVFATGNVDKTIGLWDVRRPEAPVSQLHGHHYAIRRVCFDPHSEARMLSCSYDMTVRLWDTRVETENSCMRVWDGLHSEFCVGIDISPLREGFIASCGWDEVCHFYTIDGPSPTTMR
ncbi:peroxisomal targeting signal 2 receptor [Pycnococcus provasolii]|uniref:Peroxin-7 n=1 Tax=Pycnococcus provasolii TaxID=41880 RepID=A0A830HNG1_9CHLO|nr:peroxisomal targeting signal 2 receptor [Pycnococcus provasolii]